MWKISSDNILVGFMNIACDYAVPGNRNHDRVETFGRIAAVRSLDGGRTWGAPSTIANNVELADQLIYGKAEAYPKPVDFSSSSTLLSCWSTPNSADPQAKAWFKLSEDGGETWGPAVLLPPCNIPRFQGRPSYLLRPDGVVLLFLTAKPQHNHYDRPVVYASYDGGRNWALMSMMPNSGEYRMICPSPALLADGTIVVAVRCKPSLDGAWDELYASDDGGRTWRFASRINDHGDTVHLTLLDDGRLFAVYGYRRPPYGIRARISEDSGRTWGTELIVRDDGGHYDLGYPRAVEVRDGQILAAYYFNEPNGTPTGGPRHIAGTILRV
ncbi:exo-alpha-sialidase [Paenibacillus piri]|uniref:Exo-alpha-sialidase n=2 Tax=Paenibacillus piri TaxID=2547395 RepID=A0A4R5KSU3_9BACL|nr:exo-alpha-sialidase [Paenibacillus piri]